MTPTTFSASVTFSSSCTALPSLANLMASK
jgi:hypothetical protein